MARSQALIYQSIVNTISGIPIISALVVNTSQVSYNNNFINIIARSINFLEQLMDVLRTDLEAKINTNPVGSNLWLKDKALKFQYSATVPQITALINFVPTYPIIDSKLKIITRCSVKTTAVNSVSIKVAMSEPPVIVPTTQLNAFKSYIRSTGDGTVAGKGVGIGFGGIYYDIQSYNSDKLYFNANITYVGQYSAVISANVITALNTYLSTLPFDSIIKINAVIDAIQSVQGVLDCTVLNMALRADATSFISKTFLVQNKTTIVASLPTYGGYAVGETTTGQDFATTLNFIPQ